MEMTQHNHQSSHHRTHYGKLIIMVVLSYIAMYILMYAMVDRFANVFMNINQFYMAGLMASPMVVIELLVMWPMYKNRKMNAFLIVLFIVLTGVFFLLIRQQTGVNDKQFLKSMIPHHSGAILMCEKANIKDPDIKQLCEQIRSSQQAEIEQMKAKLNELK